MKTLYKNLESYWQWRLAKILGIIIIAMIWVCGVFHIWLYFSFNPYQYAYYGRDYIRNNIIWQYADMNEIIDIKDYQMRQELGKLTRNDNIATILTERASNYESLKYLKIFVAILVYSGAIILALILLSRIVSYVIHGNSKNFYETKKENEEEKEIVIYNNPENPENK